MSRLFITPREIAFISDLTKEIIHDINDQSIILYQISEKSPTHDLYSESVRKAFSNPVKLNCLVDAVVGKELKVDQFGIDGTYKLDVYIQYRDLVDRQIQINMGDFFSWSDNFFEISEIKVLKNIFGQAEHKNGLLISGLKARADQFQALLHGPTDIKYTDPDAVQKEFVQSRGDAENSQGMTGDSRELQGILNKPLTGPKEISERGALSDDSHHLSSFYSDDET